ncbi:MAG: helix-turn-helix domain-containing protein [Syntrophotaleaceae bacterium]
MMRYALAVCDNNVIACADLPHDVVGACGRGGVGRPAKPIAADRSVAAPPENIDQPVEAEVVFGLNAMEQAERQVILDALQKHKWQVSKAVKEVGISRATMYRKMEKYAIVPPNKR